MCCCGKAAIAPYRLGQQLRQQVRMNVPTEESGQAHDYAEYCGEHCEHKEPALLRQRRHCQQRDSQGQHRIGKIKLVVVKIEFVVGLIGLVGVGLLNLLFSPPGPSRSPGKL